MIVRRASYQPPKFMEINPSTEQEMNKHFQEDFFWEDSLWFRSAIGTLKIVNGAQFFKDYFNPRTHHLLRLGYMDLKSKLEEIDGI